MNQKNITQTSPKSLPNKNKTMKLKRLLFISLALLTLSSCNFGKVYGKHGQCNGITKEGNQCKNNADESGYCGVHN